MEIDFSETLPQVSEMGLFEADKAGTCIKYSLNPKP